MANAHRSKSRKAKKQSVGFAMLGLEQDKGSDRREKRINKFRPTVAFALQEKVHFDKLYVGVQEGMEGTDRILGQICEDVRYLLGVGDAECMDVRGKPLSIADPYDLNECIYVMRKVVQEIQNDNPGAMVYVNLNTGTHTMQAAFCLVAMQSENDITLTQVEPKKGHRAQSSPTDRNHEKGRASSASLGCDLKEVNLSWNRAAQERYEKLQEEEAHLSGDISSALYLGSQPDFEAAAYDSSEPLLFLGDTGTGKTHVAKKVHDIWRSHCPSKRAGEFKECNCASFGGDENIAKSELFGHVAGAYTGAFENHDGLLKQADGGTLFLDEIGELPLGVQAMLLKALEEKHFYRLGDTTNHVESRFRLICATNVLLGTNVHKGAFRNDLYERIRTWTFPIPPLCERRETIPNLVDVFLREWNEEAINSLGEKAPTVIQVCFAGKAKNTYLDYAVGPNARWVGNVRELKWSVRRLATVARSAKSREPGRITEDIVKREISRLTAEWQSKPVGIAGGNMPEDPASFLTARPEGLSAIEWIEQLLLGYALSEAHGNKAEAGRKLYGIPGNASVNFTATYNRREAILKGKSKRSGRSR